MEVDGSAVGEETNPVTLVGQSQSASWRRSLFNDIFKDEEGLLRIQGKGIRGKVLSVKMSRDRRQLAFSSAL